jgi:Uncharacterized protein conserved in bacteria (DUF2313).
MIREIDLLSYLPALFQEIREMKTIMETENPEFQAVSDESEVVLNNQFINTCDVVGIKMFENLFGIQALDDDTLDNRKFRILSVWNNAIPYTAKVLRERLELLCGKGGYFLDIGYDSYKITVKVALVSKKNYDSVGNLLQNMVPCNMVIDLSLLYNQHLTLHQFTHAHLHNYTYGGLREEVIT